MRKAIVAGQFYPAEKKELIEQIESCFSSKFGPGNINNISKSPSIKSSTKLIRGMISPHAGYIYSGPCASHGFSEFLKMKKENLPTTFILLGPNHSGYANSSFSLSLEDFETPLGIVNNNKELGKKLLEKCASRLTHDELAHAHEHSLEVQLPFLQHVYKLKSANFQIIPLVISTNNYESCIELAESIAQVLKDDKEINNPNNTDNVNDNNCNLNNIKVNNRRSDKNLCDINSNKVDSNNLNSNNKINRKEDIRILASSDFTHFGESYGFKPFSKNIKEKLYSLDNEAISKILHFDSQGFYEKAAHTTICGMFGIVILIEILKNLGIRNSKLLKYCTSGDITEDYNSAVGYASMIFY